MQLRGSDSWKVRELQEVGFTCCHGTHGIEDSTHTVRYYPLEDSVQKWVHEFISFYLFAGFKPTTSPLRIPQHTRGFSQQNYTSMFDSWKITKQRTVEIKNHFCIAS
jgi:hypothetical protein